MKPTENLKLKVCGLTQLAQIQELISLNTDFLGFIFYEKSPRFVLNHLSLEEISEINHQGKVGVFVNESIEKIAKITEKTNLNFIQLHGDEDENFIIELKKSVKKEVKLIKVFRVGETFNFKFSILNSLVDYFLFDTDSKAFGGTGKSFDWQILNEIEIPKPYFLSGGISPENLENIKILNQKPLVLDINSKFETEPGSKDLEKIKTFKSLLK
ncbi:phosphoribosylanthranilate isomerase [Cloacibacterium sp. TD35]|uniref:phosphoribosylanthranilate isomerase n=1 Tax=Cloacibacterium sp. TD35 TaxID=2976818 RepID=UPI00237E561D|nr:phosphoribosylanthranilate isomerase [Cloacibacterium sp. TD35]WDT67608.1 phosphoribosylanthranilate isomerase [Cloacibacterium sp. TD35]